MHAILHAPGDFMAIDYEKEYDNRGRVPEHPEIFARNERDAAAYRAAAPAPNSGSNTAPRRARSSTCFPAPQAGPLAMFIHGGWWRTRDPSAYSHLAIGPNAQGVSVAVVGYDLCPQVSIATIIEQMRAACLYLWRKKHQRMTGLSAIRPAGISPPAWSPPTGRRLRPTRRPIWCPRATRSPACSISRR